MRRLFAFVLAAVPAFAQDKPQKIDPRWFLPRDHERLAVVEFAALRESEFWESIGPSVLGLLLKQGEREMGVPFERFDRLTFVSVPKPATNEDDAFSGDQDVVVIEGNGPLGDPETQCANWQKDRIGGRDVYSRGDWFPEMRLWPRPDLRVHGTPKLLEELLEREPQPGLPCADLLSLLAGKHKPVAFVAGSVAGKDGLEMLAQLVPGATWPEGGAPTFFALRLLLPSAAKDGEEQAGVQIRLTIRHANADTGVQITHEAIESLLAQGKKDRRLAAVHKVLRSAVVTRDGIDLHVVFDCGRERDAAGVLSTIATFSGVAMAIGFAPREVEVQQLEVLPDPAEPETPPNGGNGGR